MNRDKKFRDMDHFLDYIRFERQLSKNTQNAYRRDLAKYFDFLSKHALDYKHISHTEVLQFFKLLNLSQSASSVSRILSSLRNFYSFLIREEKTAHNPFADISNPKMPKKLLEVLTEAEVDRFLESIPSSTPLQIRDRAMFELLYACGLRVSEMVDLQMNNIDFGQNLLFFVGKGSKERITPIGHSAMEALKKYISLARDQLSRGPEDHVFLNRFGKKMTRQGFWKIIKKYAKKLGVGKKVYPHIFRHSFATHMLERGADIRTVQELLGHSSISTTEIYTTITKKHLKAVYFRYHPRER